MSTYKKTGPGGFDYAVPSMPPPPNKPPHGECPPPPPACPPPDWGVYPFYPPYPEVDAAPVPRPPIPCPPPKYHELPPPPPMPPCPPYAPPRPERVDECSKKLAKLSQKSKVLVQMIKDFEQRNKPAILTIGNNSYQFGTENVTDFNGDAAKGMYANLICGEAVEQLDEMDYTVDDTKTRVALKDPKDILQSELARVRQEITLVAAALNNEVIEETAPAAAIPGVGD